MGSVHSSGRPGRRATRRLATLAAAACIALAACSGDGGEGAETTVAPAAQASTTTSQPEQSTTTRAAPSTTKATTTTAAPKPKPKPKPAPRGPQETPRKIAVMVENLYSPNRSQSGRPQWGLSGAQVMVEAVVEGGITRFMAIYDSDVPGPPLIGPVRSARLPFVQIAHGFDAEYAHWGGSQFALELLADPQYGQLNAEGNAVSGFRRTSERSAPHNGITNWEMLNHTANALGRDQVSVIDEPWRTEPAKPKAPKQVGAIGLTFSTNRAMDVCFQYNRATNSYDRYTRSGAMSPHVELLTGAPLSPTTVIVMEMDATIFSNGRSRYVHTTTTGYGPLYVFKNGQRVDGGWSRPTTDKQIALTAHDGKKIALPPGQVWVSLITRSEGGTLDPRPPGSTCVP